MRGKAKVTLPKKHIASVCHMTLCCESALFLQECFFHLCFVLSVMDDKIEQHVCIKFYVKLGKSATRTLEMLHHAFGEHSLSQTMIFEWQLHFKASRVSVEGDER
jgi:hypothetical protein